MKAGAVQGVQRLTAGAAAFAFFFAPLALYVVGVRPVAFENRELARAPALDDGWAGLDLTSAWASDHLPGRLQAVRADSWLDFHVLGELPRQTSTQTPAFTAVRGKDGYLFLGSEFTAACEFNERFSESMRAWARTAEIIKSSGRTVVFSVAPNKSSVTTAELPDPVPHGACATDGIRAENEMIDAFRHPRYFSVRADLADAHSSGRQVYWRTDSHWTTVGGAIYARALARELAPALASRIQVHRARLTKVGDLARLTGLTSTETVPSAVLATGGTVREDPGSPGYDPVTPVFEPQRWTTRPATGLVPGRSVLVGDSFTYATLPTLQPLFARGTFIWIGYSSERQIIAEIVRSDTVVMSLAQRSVVTHLFTTERFQRRLAAKLSAASR
jgi:hypothetical protein